MLVSSDKNESEVPSYLSNLPMTVSGNGHQTRASEPPSHAKPRQFLTILDDVAPLACNDVGIFEVGVILYLIVATLASVKVVLSFLADHSPDLCAPNAFRSCIPAIPQVQSTVYCKSSTTLPCICPPIISLKVLSRSSIFLSSTFVFTIPLAAIFNTS